jgi:alkyl sulfatase BDS1-like metallo-beta-lactamase superfamily hydrolase
MNMEQGLMRKHHFTRLQGVAAAMFLLGNVAAGAASAPNPATGVTAAANRAVLDTLPFKDKADLEDARRGFIAAMPETGLVSDAHGGRIWDYGAFGFVKGDAPDTVNPSLWRQAMGNNVAGLFKVTERLYQVRGIDISNMDIIEGDTGLIIVDPLVSAEQAKAGLALYYMHRPQKPVVAVIYSHSHADHFGGVKGVVDEADVKAGKVKIYAPVGFMEEAIAENVVAGNAMNRRATYMYGALLPRSAQGLVDNGLGKATSGGTITLVPPTDLITQPFESRRIDGVDIDFQLAPETEAPAEMHMYFPQFRVLCPAENATRTMHNLLTPRGALVRDARKWSQQVDASRVRFADKADILIAQHLWPVWGRERIESFLADTRDMYAYMHDQTVRLMNKGYTPTQIADQLRTLPPNLANKWYARGYYGTLSYNVRAVYQRYLGFWDGNPANLNPLPPVEGARKTIEWMGGADAVLARAKDAYAKGEYRWVAQIANQLVFAQPDNADARHLEADALEQLGYQDESGPWRNIYLTGAQELRDGVAPRTPRTAGADVVRAMTPDMLFTYMSVRLNADKIGDQQAVINWNFTDTGGKYAMTLRNRVLTVVPQYSAAKADVTVTLPKLMLAALGAGVISVDQAVKDGKIKVEGDAGKVATILGSLDSFTPDYPIVTPVVNR